MKNKKFTYVLLPLALLIWGMIIYKVFFYTNTEENNVAFSHHAGVAKTQQMKTDTFSLLLNYRDPFLKNAAKANISSSQTAQSVKKTPQKPQPEKKPVVFPPLRYEGTVNNRNKTLAIVNINGKSKFVQPGETFDNMKLAKVYNDSIVISYEKQNKTIRKQ